MGGQVGDGTYIRGVGRADAGESAHGPVLGGEERAGQGRAGDVRGRE